MKKLYYLPVLFILFYFSGLCQKNDGYIVINFLGEVQYVTNNSGLKKVLIGDRVDENTSIRIALNSFVTIFDLKRNQYLILNGERIIKLKDVFTKNIAEKPKGLPEFLSRLFSDFTDIFSSDAQSKRKFRDGEAIPKLNVISPKKCRLINNKVTFRWLRRAEDKSFRFVLYDENFRLLKDTALTKTFLVISDPSIIKRGQEYIWQIISNYNSDKSKELTTFKMAEDSVITRVDSLLFGLKEVMRGNNIQFNLLEGMLYENEQFFTDALECYLSVYKKNTPDKNVEFLITRVMEKLKIKSTFKELLNNL